MNGSTVVEVKKVGGHDFLYVNNSIIESHEVLGVLGHGANGVVYLTRNLILKRKEAIKVWLKNRDKDNRDKLKQGLAESIKLAVADKDYSIEIYSVHVIDDTLVAIMEYIEGETLRDFRSRVTMKYELKQVIDLYLEAIERTTTSELFHGDPHLSNVLVYNYSPDMYTDEIRLKLCDFGTSIFSGKEDSINRHWRLVEESVIKLTQGLEGYENARKELLKFKAHYEKNVDIDAWKEFATDKQVAEVINSPLRQYLDCFEWSSLNM